MAGTGSKLWATGDTVTASAFQTYVQDQVVAVYDDSASRDAAFGGAGEPALAEGRLAYVKDTNEFQIYSGSAWVSVLDIDSFDTTKIELNKDSGSAYVQVTSAHDTEATTPYFIFRKSDGSNASPALVDDGAALGTISFQGYDGNSFATGATIQALVDGTPGDGDMPTEMIFSTSADGSESPTSRMVIGANGIVVIGASASTNANHNLEVHDTSTKARIYAHGTGSGYTHSDIRLDATGSTRGAGMYTFNDDMAGGGEDVTWFTGSPWNGADNWIVARASGTSFSEGAANAGIAFITVANTGYTGFNVQSPTVRIHLAGGSASSTNSGIAAAWDTHSSVRWKTDVADITNAVNTVKQLRPVTFKYKDPDTAEVSDMTEIGFIAEELRDHVPSVVRNEEKDPEDNDNLHLMDNGNPYGKGVDYGRLSSLSIAALQELITRVEALESA